MRLFIAIPLTKSAREKLGSLEKPIRGLKWTNPEQMHLTLKFVGETDPPVAGDLKQALREISFNTFDIKLNSMGYFPPRKYPRVLWAGVDAPDQLFTLQQMVEDISAQFGAKSERFDYKPHITVARVDTASKKEILQYIEDHQSFEHGPFTVDRFILYESELRSEGAVHKEIEIYRAD